jgi:hypothetical protein
MPYIDIKTRNQVDKSINFYNILIESSGVLCYIIYQFMLLYMKLHGKSFRTISEINGAIECAKMEFYRKEVAPYEDEKIKLNGDCV